MTISLASTRAATAGALLLVALAVLSSSCTAHLLSRPNPQPSRLRPIAKIETTAGVEYGAATDHGILFLARTAQSGPCRVHYFLGDQRFVEDGVIEPVGGNFYRAAIDLEHQQAHFLGRDLTPRDPLIAMWIGDGDVRETTLRLSNDRDITGDVANYPGLQLPIGTPLFVREGDQLMFCGLVSGEASLLRDGREQRFVLFSGPDRVREMLLTPRPDPEPREIKHRADGLPIQ